MTRFIPVLALLTGTAAAQIVPAPKHFAVQGSGFIQGHVVRCDDKGFRSQAGAFAEALRGLGVREAAIHADADAGGVVHFVKEDALPAAGYRIAGETTYLKVSARTPVGAAHAAASLLQTVAVKGGQARWPRLRIEDEPDLPYRSFLVDMGRNPHSPKTLRQVVDMMWFYKANYLQLHLTDDQLISWPSKAFPKLYSRRAGWTWEDFVALERYAQARGVTIIPELEVPGHSSILRRQYPEVFGKTPTELASNPQAQAGVEKLIDELLSVFKSTPYIHIGGDEAYGVPEEVQRDFINRLNRYVKSKGRHTVVWEGPRLGKGPNKVDEDVIHLNWRTINFPAQAMLEAGYKIVNASWDPLYIVDHYPRTMFTAVDVERCYHWDLRRFAHVDPGFPTFKKPHRTRTAEGILGFCMPWWEGRETNLMRWCLPRLAAVASAAWNRAGERDFADFQRRQERAVAILEAFAGIVLPETPFADPASQKSNLAYRAKVTPSWGAHQPPFGPDRLTNGRTNRFDQFLGFPTQPKPLEIVLELKQPARISRIVVYETAVGKSHEVYDLLVSADGRNFVQIGSARQGSRGNKNYVEHRFAARPVAFIKLLTQGCHGLTFPSFSRLCEVMAFAE